MSWCRLEPSYLLHPKTVQLCTLLGDADADRYLPRLWSWAAGSCPTGTLPLMIARVEFESACRWRGKPGALFDSLVEVGLVEVTVGVATIHDWLVYNGYQLRESQRLRELKARDTIERTRAGTRQPHACRHAARTDGRTDVQTNGQTKAEETTSNVTPLPRPAPRLPPVPSPYQLTWNEHRGTLGEWRMTSAPREKALKAMAQRHPVEQWLEAVKRAAASPFLTGTNDRGWRADVDFLLRPGKVEEVLEGKYDDRVVERRGKNGLLGVAHNVAQSYENDPLFNPKKQ